MCVCSCVITTWLQLTSDLYTLHPHLHVLPLYSSSGHQPQLTILPLSYTTPLYPTPHSTAPHTIPHANSLPTFRAISTHCPHQHSWGFISPHWPQFRFPAIIVLFIIVYLSLDMGAHFTLYYDYFSRDEKYYKLLSADGVNHIYIYISLYK